MAKLTKKAKALAGTIDREQDNDIAEGDDEASFGDPLGPLCDESEGQLCLTLLYADAWATEDGETSSSRSRLADALPPGFAGEYTNCGVPATRESPSRRR